MTVQRFIKVDPIDWCEQRLLVRGNPLTASLPFAPPDQRNRILGLRAIIAEIASVPDTVSDPEIGLAKLGWWKRAMRENLPHPARQALETSGAAAMLDDAQVESLIDAVAATLDNPRFENREQAWAFCLRVGGPAAQLEAGLLGASPELALRFRTLGATAYLVRLVRDLAIDARNHRWLVPLDIQAEFQVARQDVAAGRVGAGFDGLVRAWLDDGFRRSEREVKTLAPADAWRHRHLLIQYALDRRLAAKLERRPRRILGQRVLTGPMGNAWCAWRTARAVRRHRHRD